MPAVQGFFRCVFHAASSPFVTQRLPQVCGESYSSDPTIFGFSFWALLTFCCSSQSSSSSRRTRSRFPMWNAGKVASSASLSSRKNCAGGLGYTPEMRLWISKRYACKTHLLPRRCQINPIPIQIRIFPKVNRRLIHAVHKSEKILKSNPKPQSESVVIHPKILTRKSESVLIHSQR